MPRFSLGHWAVRLFIGAVAASSLTATASAQLPQTRLQSIFPAGGKAGEAVEITLTGGTDLDELDGMLFSHPGIQAKKKDGATNVFTVTVAGDVPTGPYEARVHGLYGTSNPRIFSIGQLPEVKEVEPNATKETATPIQIGSVVNGQSAGGADIDLYKLTGKAGQRVLIECEALAIDSKFQGELRITNAAGKLLGRASSLAKKVDPILDVTFPADGEYILRVVDAVYGNGADYSYRLKVHAGPHVDYVVPPVGVPGSTANYTLFGRNLPGGQPSNVVIDGHKLDQLTVQIALPNTPDKLDFSSSRQDRQVSTDGASYVFRGPTGAANPISIGFAPKPVVAETEPNNEQKAPQKIQVPTEIVGAFQQKSDIDVFEFEAKAQQVLWFEVFGERLGSLADPFLAIDKVNKNEKGEETLQRLASQDDSVVNAVDAKLFDTNSDDVAYRFVAPADGTYRVSLRDRYFEARGAANLQYHLAIRDENPEFRLVAVPFQPAAAGSQAAAGYQMWDLGLRRGENLSVTVAALRQHGFAGVIDVAADGLPAGVTVKGASIGPGQNAATLIFSAAEDAKPITQPIRIVGTARIDSAVAVKAVTDADAALVAAVAQVPKLDMALQKTVDPLKQAEAARKQAEDKFNADAAAAKTAEDAKVAVDKKVTDADALVKASTEEKTKAQQALDQKKDDQALKDALAAADKKLADANQALATAKNEQQQATNNFNNLTNVAKQSDAVKVKAVQTHEQAVAANKKATDDKQAGDAAVAKAQQTLAAAKQARDAAARNVAHEARSGTIVFNGAAQNSAHARLAQNFMLSVMDEAAPIQLTTEVFREVANHGRQIIVPVKLAKRNGFDNQVTLAFQGMPQNLQVTNVNIEKGKDSALLRVFVPNNVAEGTYTMYVQATAQVPYAKNPVRLNRAKAEVEAATAGVTTAMEAAKKAAADADAATKAVAAMTEVMKKAQADLEAAKKKLQESQAAAQKADQDSVAAAKVAADADAKNKQAVEAANKAKEEAAKDAANQDLAKKAQDATQAAATADAAFKQATEAAAAAKKKAEEAAVAVKAATDATTAAQGNSDKATQEVTKANEAKKVADDAKVKADAAQKAATDRKTAADNELKAADTYSKSLNNGNPQVFPPSTPIVITVKKAPFTLAANVQNGGNVKKGDKVEVKLTVSRINGYTGPVKLTIPAIPGVVGIGAEAVTIPADKNEASIFVTAAGDAANGAVANLVVRGEADWDGPAASDQPNTINVQ